MQWIALLFVWLGFFSLISGNPDGKRKHCDNSNLPFLPTNNAIAKAVQKLDSVAWANAKYIEKVHQIPKVFWLKGEEAPEHMLNEHMIMMANNTKFKYIVFNDLEADQFLNTVFKDTSYLWAYHTLNHRLGAGKADIFRYALLYVFGGVWMDLDDVLYSNLETYIEPQDGFIMGTEGLWGYISKHCYDDQYHLRNAPHDSKDFSQFLPWANRRILQSIMISRPRHPLMARTMENIVTVFRDMKCRNDTKVLRDKINPQHKLLCTTGPYLLTVSARQLAYEYSNSTVHLAQLGIRVAGEYYRDLMGRPKLDSHHANSRNSPTYWKTLLDNGTSLLSDFSI